MANETASDAERKEFLQELNKGVESVTAFVDILSEDLSSEKNEI